MAAYGFNNVVPARGGDVMKLFLTKTSIPNASYPAVASSMFVELVFDGIIAIPVLAFAFSQGVFPKPPDFSKLDAFDLSWFASHPQFTLFVLTALGILVMVGFAVLSRRGEGFLARGEQGVGVLRGPQRDFPGGVLGQVRAWG